jgi:hypothetical protein
MGILQALYQSVSHVSEFHFRHLYSLSFVDGLADAFGVTTDADKF